MLDYKAQLDLPIPSNSNFFEGGSQAGYFNMLTGRDAQRGKDWSVGIAYVPAVQRLDFTEVSIPLKSPHNDESLVFRRANNGHFLPYTSQNGRETELATAHSADDKFIAIPAVFISRLMEEAGYDMPELFISPDDLRLHMAETTGRATNWRVEESVVIPEDTELQTTIKRVHSSSKRIFTKFESPKRAQSSNPKRMDTEVVLTAIGEFVDADKRSRRQLVIEFEGSDYYMQLPRVSLRELQPDGSTLSLPDGEQYICVRSQDQRITAELLEQLIHSLVDTMTGYYN